MMPTSGGASPLRSELDPVDVLLAPAVLASAGGAPDLSLFGVPGPFSSPAGADDGALAELLRRPTLRLQLTVGAADGTTGVLTLVGTPEVLVLCGPGSYDAAVPTLVYGDLAAAARLAVSHLAADWPAGGALDTAPAYAAWAAARFDGDRVVSVTTEVLQRTAEEPFSAGEQERCAELLIDATVHAVGGRHDATALDDAGPEIGELLARCTFSAGLMIGHEPTTVMSGPGGTAIITEVEGALQVRRAPRGLVITVYDFLLDHDVTAISLTAVGENRLIDDWTREADELDWSPHARTRALTARLIQHHTGAAAAATAVPGDRAG